MKWVKLVKKFLLTGGKFMPKLHLRQPWFTYSACGPFAKKRERIQKARETSSLKHLYRNKLDRGCFSHDATYYDTEI